MNYSKDDELVEDYVKGSLSDAERSAFEERLHKEPELLKALEFEQYLHKTLELYEVERLKEHARTLLQQSKDSHSIRPIPERRTKIRRLWYSTAAAILLLGAAAFWFYQVLYSPSLEQITNRYLTERYPAPVVSKGAPRTAVWSEVISAYRQQDYETSIRLLQVLLDENNATTEQVFYLGLCYLYREPANLDRALAYLQQARDANPTLYGEAVDWYMSLAYLKAEQRQEAKSALERVVGSSSWKQEEARDLLRKLSRE